MLSCVSLAPRDEASASKQPIMGARPSSLSAKKNVSNILAPSPSARLSSSISSFAREANIIYCKFTKLPRGGDFCARLVQECRGIK